jgi:hypothetical protein
MRKDSAIYRSKSAVYPEGFSSQTEGNGGTRTFITAGYIASLLQHHVEELGKEGLLAKGK